MKNLLLKLIIPLTIISFVFSGKKWFVRDENGFEFEMYGFPLPFVCDAWYTSLALQIFVFEFVINIFTYFSFWFLLVLGVNRYLWNIKVHKTVQWILWIVAGFFLLLATFYLSLPDHLYYLKRDFEIEIVKTELLLPWE